MANDFLFYSNFEPSTWYDIPADPLLTFDVEMNKPFLI